MAEPLFQVDLSEDARDYCHTALEPGLPMLDRQGINFQILKKWLGDYVAEPEWRGEDTIAFFLREEGRGRLENVDCQPCTKSDLEKTFAANLEEIRAKVKKAKPESSTEQLVHRTLKKAVAEQTNDLESSDFDSYFFRCRAGNEPWKLIWCLGYQRRDLEPLKAKFWSTPGGDFLGVRPPLSGGRVKKRKRVNPLVALATSPLFLLLLVALLGAFLFFNRPKLVVSPQEWHGPLGSRVEFKVVDHRWFFFKKDVTDKTLPHSHDERVVKFDRHGLVANAANIGRTGVMFMISGREPIVVNMDVTEPLPPDSLSIELADGPLSTAAADLAIGSTQQLKAIGHYADGSSVDLTGQVSWWEHVAEGGNPLLAFHDTEKGLIQGDSAGAATVMARYPIPRDDDSYAESSLAVQVNRATFATMVVQLEPANFAIGQSSRINVLGVDDKGVQHSLVGSSLLKYKVDPATAAQIEGDYLMGLAEGPASLKVAYDQLEKDVAFNVSGNLLGDDIFLVSPTTVTDAVVYELIPLNVTSGSDAPIEAVSANPAVVEVLRTEDENAGYEVWLAARGVGQADVTVKQGAKSAQVAVTVTDGKIESLAFDPPAISLNVPVEERANLVGTVTSGPTVRRIQIATDALVWERQPRVENVYLDKQTLLMKPLEATEIPQDLRARLADTGLVADGTVEVRAGDQMAFLEIDGEFGVHPPVPARGRYITAGGYIGDDVLYYDSTLGGLAIDRRANAFGPLGSLPAGAVLTELNGRSLLDMNEADLAAYLRANPILSGDVIRYRGADGALGTLLLGGRPGVVVDFKLLAVRSSNVSADSFDAELQFYLRQAGEYRLTDAAGEPLTDWQPVPSDSTPVINALVMRNAADDYDLYLERRIGPDVKRFQVPFKLENQAAVPTGTTIIDAPEAPVIPDAPTTVIEGGTRTIVDGPDTVIDGGKRRVVIDRGGKETVIEIDRDGSGKRTVKVNPNDGAASGSSSSGGGSRSVTVNGSGSGNGEVGSGSAGSGSGGNPSPGSNPPGSPNSGSPSPNSPSPNSPNSSTDPSDSSPSKPNSPSPNSPNSPSPTSPSPNSPSPSPPSPSSPSLKPSSPSSNSPSPGSPSPSSPTPPSPTPSSPASPNPTSPAPSPSSPDSNSPTPNSPTPSSTDPSSVAPASAYGDTVPSKPGENPAGGTGSSFRPRSVGGATAGGVGASGKITGPVGKTEIPLSGPRYAPSKISSEDPSKSPVLDGLQRFRDERKKRENITGQGRTPVIRTSEEDRIRAQEQRDIEKAKAAAAAKAAATAKPNTTTPAPKK